MAESNSNSNPNADSNSSTCGRQGRPKKRARVISSLTDEQLQHKRNVDRKAQRAFRQRTKDSIDRLEQQIATVVKTAAESEAKFQHELATVRERNHTLQRCLEHISELASTAVRSISFDNRSSHNQDAGIEHYAKSPSPEAHHPQNVAADSDPPHDSVLNPSQLVTPIASEHEGAGGDARANTAPERPEKESALGLLPVGILPTHQRHASVSSNDLSQQQQQQSPPPQIRSPIGEAVSCLYDHGETAQHISPTSHARAGAGYPSPSASHQFATVDPDLEEGSQSHSHLTQAANNELCDGVVISHHTSDSAPTVSTVYGVRSNSVSTVLPSHVLPTCPLDEILHNFMISRRDLITQGEDVSSAAGPPKPTVKALLDPNMTSSVHPLCGIMSEVLSTFAHVNQPEKLAFYYLMYKTMRWQIAPSQESYLAMPTWLRPTVTQITIQHAAWIDNIPWPGVRDILIENPDDHPFDIFSQYYSHNVSVNWHYDVLDAVTDIDNEVVLHSIFEKHVCNLKNWTVSSDFQSRFPYMSSAIYSRD